MSIFCLLWVSGSTQYAHVRTRLPSGAGSGPMSSPFHISVCQRRNANVGCLIAFYVCLTPERRRGLPQLLTLRSRRH